MPWPDFTFLPMSSSTPMTMSLTGATPSTMSWRERCGKAKVLYGPTTVANHSAAAQGVDGKLHASDVKCARMLLDAGTRHVHTFRALYHSDEIPDEVFGFHVQQAAEKLLKGWIAFLGEMYPLTHNVEELLNLLASRDSAVEPFRDLVDYTPYAVEFRYAGVDPGTQPIDRAGALALVQALLERAERRWAEVGETR